MKVKHPAGMEEKQESLCLRSQQAQKTSGLPWTTPTWERDQLPSAHHKQIPSGWLAFWVRLCHRFIINTSAMHLTTRPDSMRDTVFIRGRVNEGKWQHDQHSHCLLVQASDDAPSLMIEDLSFRRSSPALPSLKYLNKLDRGLWEWVQRIPKPWQQQWGLLSFCLHVWEIKANRLSRDSRLDQ